MTGLQVTIHPGSDVLIPCGARWDSLRAPLAHLLQRPELLTAPLWADGVGLDTSAIVGERPLLAGALITTTPLPYSRWGRRERPAQ
ncbi:MAG: hypothetical protein LBB54_03070, partial [Cellulomonadaceae bacterium]|nr:hypothetical protein [Cellulomonadaceae bacterium]